MNFDLFISHAHEDKQVADAICSALESGGVRCWIAPRDIQPGIEWAEAIVEAIEECRIMVVVFSRHSNISQQVIREVTQAVNKESVIIPFRIADIPPSKSLRYFLDSQHWLNALTPPLEQHISTLVASVHSLLEGNRAVPAWGRPVSAPGNPGPSIDVAPDPDSEFADLTRTRSQNRFLQWIRNILEDR